MFGRHNKLSTDWLKSISLFDAFNEEQLEELATLGEREDFVAGDTIVDQGRYGDKCFVIVEGSAKVFMSGEFVTTVNAETMVGEMALIEHRPRNASVIADVDLVAVSFGIEEFNAILDRNPMIKSKVTNLLNQRAAENVTRD